MITHKFHFVKRKSPKFMTVFQKSPMSGTNLAIESNGRDFYTEIVPKLVHFLKSPKIGTTYMKKVPPAGLKSPKIRTLNNIIYNIIFNIIFKKK